MLLAGKGMLLTSDTPIASPPPPAPHVDPPCGSSMPEKINTTARPMCRPAETARGLPSPACSKKISSSACISIQRLRYDAHGRDARPLDRIHHRGECAEGHILIGADEYRLVLRIADFLAKLRLDLVDVDRVVAQKHALLLVDADHHALFGDLFNGARPGNVNLNARLQYRRGDHKDDQQHQHHVDQRSDVDVGDGGLRPAVGSGESHQRLAPAVSAMGAAGMVVRSTAFSISRAKSSPRAANSRIELPIRL